MGPLIIEESGEMTKTSINNKITEEVQEPKAEVAKINIEAVAVVAADKISRKVKLHSNKRM